MVHNPYVAPGWHQRRMLNFQILTAGGYQEEDPVNDGWTEMEEIRARVASLVADPATAEALEPWCRQFCKRPAPP